MTEQTDIDAQYAAAAAPSEPVTPASDPLDAATVDPYTAKWMQDTSDLAFKMFGRAWADGEVVFTMALNDAYRCHHPGVMFASTEMQMAERVEFWETLTKEQQGLHIEAARTTALALAQFFARVLIAYQPPPETNLVVAQIGGPGGFKA